MYMQSITNQRILLKPAATKKSIFFCSLFQQKTLTVTQFQPHYKLTAVHSQNISYPPNLPNKLDPQSPN